MAEKAVIPLADLRVAARVPRVPEQMIVPTGQLADRLARPLRDLRIARPTIAPTLLDDFSGILSVGKRRPPASIPAEEHG